MKFPWETEQLPAPVEATPPAALSTEETLSALQRDVAYMVTHTAVRVHSNRPELCALVNTPRGQIIPRGVCTFADGTTTEFLDIGMPQPGAPTVNCITDLAKLTLDTALNDLGLKL